MSDRLVLMALAVHDFCDELVLVDYLTERLTRLHSCLLQGKPLLRIVALAVFEASETLKHAYLRVGCEMHGTLCTLAGE